jgi:hypothetical protein
MLRTPAHEGARYTSVVAMPPMPHPKSTIDLMLAPVAVEIDSNLQDLRDTSPGEIDDYLQRRRVTRSRPT